MDDVNKQFPPQGAMNPGYDPYNNVGVNAGTPPPPGPQTPPVEMDADAHGTMPPNTPVDHAMIIRAMHNAYSNKGVNPYDSHPEQKKKWERAWKDKANREALKAAGGKKADKGSEVQKFFNPAIGDKAKAEARLVDKIIDAARRRTNQARAYPNIKR